MEPMLRFKADDGSEFPKWEEKRLDEVVEFLDGLRKPLEAGERVAGPYPYYGASGIIDYVENYIFDDELILLSEDGANIIDRNYRVAFLAKGKYWVNNHAHVLKAVDSNVDYFICEQLESFDYRKYNSGGAQPKLNQATCRSIIMRMPCIEEQRKIADCLSSVDDIITATQSELLAWQERKKGVMQKIFNREVRFKADDGSEFPEWEEKRLDEVVEFLDGLRKPLEAGERVAGPYPYYGASGIIDYVENYIFDDELVLLSEDGANIIDRNYRVAFLAKGKYWVNNHAHVLKAVDSNVNYFICEQLESFDYRKYNSGGAQPKLNQATCRSIIMRMPCVEEQCKIADCLSSLDDVINQIQAELSAWKEFKKGLLQQMFV